MAKWGVAVGVDSEVPCGDGYNSAVGWKDSLKWITRETQKQKNAGELTLALVSRSSHPTVSKTESTLRSFMSHQFSCAGMRLRVKGAGGGRGTDGGCAFPRTTAKRSKT